MRAGRQKCDTPVADGDSLFPSLGIHFLSPEVLRMRFSVSSCLLPVLLAAAVGCGGDEPRRATEGASQQAIEEYEAAVAAAEGNMQESMEEDPTASQE